MSRHYRSRDYEREENRVISMIDARAKSRDQVDPGAVRYHVPGFQIFECARIWIKRDPSLLRLFASWPIGVSS